MSLLPGIGRVWATWLSRHDTAAVLTLFPSEVLAERRKVVMKPREKLLCPNSANPALPEGTLTPWPKKHPPPKVMPSR